MKITKVFSIILTFALGFYLVEMVIEPSIWGFLFVIASFAGIVFLRAEERAAESLNKMMANLWRRYEQSKPKK